MGLKVCCRQEAGPAACSGRPHPPTPYLPTQPCSNWATLAVNEVKTIVIDASAATASVTPYTNSVEVTADDGIGGTATFTPATVDVTVEVIWGKG